MENKTKIGETGYGFIINEHGNVIFSPKTEGTLKISYNDNLNYETSLFDNEDPNLVQAVKHMAAGETGISLINIDGTSYYLAYTPLENTKWSFGAVLEELEVTMSADLNKHLIENSTNQFVEVLNSSIKMMILAMLAVFVIIIVLVAFAGRSLADKFTKPIFATMNAAKEVGGNFYDFYFLDDNHLVITIADVSGKGIPAALFMMISKTILKNFAMTMSNPDDFVAVMALSNNQLCQNNDAMMFVTIFMGMLDIKTGEFVFVNGGHNPPMVYHKATDSYEYIKVNKNFVLGGMEDINFKQQSIKLDKGDIIFMYTDGVTEALNPNNELYGEERLINCLNRSDKNLSIEELLAFFCADVNNNVNGADQSDDITMLALKIN